MRHVDVPRRDRAAGTDDVDVRDHRHIRPRQFVSHEVDVLQLHWELRMLMYRCCARRY